MAARKLYGALGSVASFAAVLASVASVACKPTPEAACKAAADAFDRCAKSPTEKWADSQVQKCVGDVRASGFEKSVVRCAEMKQCESARTCLMILFAGASKK